MILRNVRRLGALTGVTILALLTMAPALAATTVSQASANALTIAVAGNGHGSGTVTATHDGKQESVRGETAPPVRVLGNQQLVNSGVLAQEATASADGDGAGASAACAGIAGQGGSVAQIGDSSCLRPGQPIGLTFANLDLSDLVVFDEDTQLAPLNQATDPVITQAVGPLTQQLSQAVTEQAGNGGIFGGTLGAVESRCTSTAGGGAGGTTTIVDGRIGATFGGRTVGLLDFPVHPAPNTKLVTDLDKVVDLFLNALRHDLNNTLDGQAAGLEAAIDPIQDQIVNAVIGEIAPQLGPLEENVLSATLNAQARPAVDSIKVTAIHLEVLPAARAELGAPVAQADLANVTCGPNGRVTRTSQPLPEVPTVIDSGADGGSGGAGDYVLVAGALAVAGASGLIAYRRFAARS
ncbi:MAG TPA: hypothetical protein VFU85_04550 [Nocardioides sp.]|nr:hypothetical protein [Nocardioides sp.]